jgi:hypothetical protein
MKTKLRILIPNVILIGSGIVLCSLLILERQRASCDNEAAQTRKVALSKALNELGDLGKQVRSVERARSSDHTTRQSGSSDPELLRLRALVSQPAMLSARRDQLMPLLIRDMSDFLQSCSLSESKNATLLDLLARRAQYSSIRDRFLASLAELPPEVLGELARIQSELLDLLDEEQRLRLEEYEAEIPWRRRLHPFDRHLHNIGYPLSSSQRIQIVNALRAAMTAPDFFPLGDFSLPEEVLVAISRRGLLSDQQFDGILAVQRLHNSIAEARRLARTLKP